MSGAAPMVLVAVTGGPRSDAGVLACWQDGRLIWSKRDRSGGPPYRQARIAPAAISESVRSIAADGKLVGVQYYGPGVRHMHVRIGPPGDPVVDAASAHELVERNTALVATATGIEPLAGRLRADVFAAQPEAYRAFRTRWEKVLCAALALRPTSGQPALVEDVATLSWGESD
jgi:hypothetical protein